MNTVKKNRNELETKTAKKKKKKHTSKIIIN